MHRRAAHVLVGVAGGRGHRRRGVRVVASSSSSSASSRHSAAALELAVGCFDAAFLPALLLVLALELLLVELELLHLLPERLRLGLGSLVRGVHLEELGLVPLCVRAPLFLYPPRRHLLDERRLLAPPVDAVKRSGHDRARVEPAEGLVDLFAWPNGERLTVERAVKKCTAGSRAGGAGAAPGYPSPRRPASGTSRTRPSHTAFSRRRSLRANGGRGARRQSSRACSRRRKGARSEEGEEARRSWSRGRSQNR